MLWTCLYRNNKKKIPTLHNRPRLLRQHVFQSSVLFCRSFIASLLSLLITYDCSLQITSQMPNHPANSFYYPRLKELPPIASIKITRQSRSTDRQTVMSNHILPNTINQRFSGEQKLAKRFAQEDEATYFLTVLCLILKNDFIKF